MLNIKTIIKWIVMPCGLVDRYQSFRGVSLCDIMFQETGTIILAIHQIWLISAVSDNNNMRTIHFVEKYNNFRTETK